MASRLGVVLAASAFIFACSLLAWQEPAPLTVRVRVNLVNVSFIVRDAEGVLAHDLSKDDIEVYEDGMHQDIRFFDRAGDLPLRLAILLDMSGSQDKFVKQHHRDLDQFLRAALAPRDRAMLICFGDRIRLVNDFTASAGELMDSLETYEHGKRVQFAELDADDTRAGGTALFDAIYAGATRKLDSVRGERKAIVIFSDGEDNSSAHDLIDAIEAAQNADALVYSVRYTEMRRGRLTSRNRYGMLEMQRFAAETGGAGFDAARENVGEALTRVADELRSMYEVAWSSASYGANGVPDGKFHTITIRAKRSWLTIRAKPGYFAR